jgi:hypothetical protein
VLGVLIKVLPSADQANGNILAILVPLNLGFAAMWWLEAKRQRTT